MPSSAGSKRRQTDPLALMMKGFEVEIIQGDWPCHVILDVEFHGPKDTPYEGGVWIVRAHLPPAYPFQRPRLNFLNRIFHPNIGYQFGELYMEVLRRKWSPVYDLVKVFEIFLPRLLSDPYDPENTIFNQRAACLLIRDAAAYEQQVREHCAEHVRKEDIIGYSLLMGSPGPKEEGSGSDEE